MEFLDFYLSVIPIYIVELLAAIAGAFYLKKIPSLRSTKLLVLFLWITVFVELFATYPAIAGFSDFKYFGFIEDTKFYNNNWIFNIYAIGNFLFYTYYFRFYLKGKSLRLVTKYIAVAYAIASIGHLFFSDGLFSSVSQFSNIAGTLMLLSVIILFYLQLLKSDTILNLKHYLPFYISIGSLVYSLCITPVDIFFEFYSEKNYFFVQLKNYTYLFVNIFLYSTFILGFIICQREKTSY